MNRTILIGMCLASSIGYALEQDELNCKEFKFPENIVCEEVKAKINERLPEGTIKLVDGELLYEISPIAEGRISTGHSCSHTAHFRGSPNYFRVYPTADIKKPLPEVKEVSELTTNRFVLGIELDSKVGIKEEWGTRFLGKCVERTTEDSTLELNYQLNIEAAAVLNFNPVYSIDENANYVVEIKPEYTLLLNIPLNDAEYNLVGRKSNTLYQDLGNIFGDVITLNADAFTYDLGLSLVDWLDPNLFLFVGEEATEIAARRALYNFTADHEENMNNKIAEELELVDGRRTYIILDSKVKGNLMSALIPILALI